MDVPKIYDPISYHLGLIVGVTYVDVFIIYIIDHVIIRNNDTDLINFTNPIINVFFHGSFLFYLLTISMLLFIMRKYKTWRIYTT